MSQFRENCVTDAQTDGCTDGRTHRRTHTPESIGPFRRSRGSNVLDGKSDGSHLNTNNYIHRYDSPHHLGNSIGVIGFTIFSTQGV